MFLAILSQFFVPNLVSERRAENKNKNGNSNTAAKIAIFDQKYSKHIKKKDM